MSFFFKSDSDDNLQYDDTAFMHFSMSATIITSLIFTILIIIGYSNDQPKRISQIKSLPLFKKKLQKTNKKKKSYFATWGFLWKLLVVIFSMIFFAYSYSQIQGDSKMIGFDPHQILGVDIDAPVNVIKKAYRKLALQYHPDRNQNNPQAAAKFIQISKAYECLTDEEAKQNCKKYGNPDGQVSFKVGIGLPRFMMKAGNQFILIPIFVFLLFVIPHTFIKWSSRIRPQDPNGNLIANYPIMHQFFTPRFSIIHAPIMMGCMKQLDVYFPQKTHLPQEKAKWFKQMVVRTGIMNESQLNNMEPHILHRCFKIYAYMAGKQLDERIPEFFPQLCHKMVLFSCYYAQKVLQGQCLANNPNLEIMWCGIQPTRNILFFTLQMFNPSLRLGDVQSIQFLDLSQQQLKIARQNPIANIHKQLHTDESIKAYAEKFPEVNRKYIEQQIKNLPCFDLKCRAMLGDQQTKQMTIDDFATLQIKIKKARSTCGYLATKDFPELIPQKFYVSLTYNANLMYFATFTNDDFKNNELVFKIQHRQSVEREMKFSVDVMFPYPKMNLKDQINLNVTEIKQNSKVFIHEEDLQVQKVPKNFFESLASLETYNESDRQLSDGQDSEDEQSPNKSKNKFQEENQDDCSCGSEHQH